MSAIELHLLEKAMTSKAGKFSVLTELMQPLSQVQLHEQHSTFMTTNSIVIEPKVSWLTKITKLNLL